MKKLFTIAVAALAMAACTNLDEHLYSQISKEEFMKNDAVIAQYTSRPYTKLQNWGEEQSYWTLVLQIGNEMAVPKSWDKSWGEDRYVELQTHNITSSNKLVGTGWDFCFNGISACNDAIYELEKLEQNETVKRNISECKVLRVYYYFMAVDLWGQVPYSVDKTVTTLPPVKTRAEMYTWMEQELKDNMANLIDSPSTSTYGRVTKDVAKFLLAKLYINAQVYIGTAKWQEAGDICKEIMESGHFKLTSTYGQNFAIHNEGSTEAILAIPYSSTYTSHTFYPFVLTLNSDLLPLFNISAGTWNGTHMAQPDFIARYDAADLRKAETWLYGDIYDLNGQRWTIEDGVDASGKPIVKEYSLKDYPIDESHFRSGLDRMEGARIIKWPYQTDGSLTSYSVDMENDFILMRYSDVVLMYVECLIRQNKAAQAALVPEFMQIRTRAGLLPMTVGELSLDGFLEERQKEMALEGWVHNDLVRFGKYLDAWWAKPADTVPGHILLPIPEDKRGANPNLQQNPGY
ncbi:MAG: RagB/SusD family nutrient uptake outer membrane protein [Bacteroidales bacterium]|nr:RagB/SusD family nutrient uptake outer membrane protein [Bacteroidales bacterium]